MIERNSELYGNSEIIRFDAPHGSLDASFNTITRCYGISTLVVLSEHRRKGIGKELLRHARDDAVQKNAKLIFAAIISRESLVACADVFGDEAITVKSIGEFVGDDDIEVAGTNASLLLHLE